MKITQQIKDALAHYRCPACGEVEQGFSYRELQVCTFKFNPKGHASYPWPLDDMGYLEDYGYSDLERLPPVRCYRCEEQVCKPDGSPVTAYDFKQWLENLGQRWEAQLQERARLTEEMKKLYDEGLSPVGMIEALEAKIKTLEFIS